LFDVVDHVFEAFGLLGQLCHVDQLVTCAHVEQKFKFFFIQIGVQNVNSKNGT
jgi:hypothetical protein